MRVGDPRLVLMAVAVTCLQGCAGNPAPRTWRQPAALVQRSPRGAWVRLDAMELSGGPSKASRLVQGELIAIDQNAVHVLTVAGLQSVPRVSVRNVALVGYGTRAGALAAWAVGGGVSTLSHGGFLLFTAPMWAITGVIAVRTEGRAGVLRDFANSFARFPQGLPAGFDPKSLGTLPAMILAPADR
jgi:hypothetical protein